MGYRGDFVPEAAAVNVAHVPVVYHVPPLMIQPLVFPSDVTIKYPFPLNGAPGSDVPVGLGAVVDVGGGSGGATEVVDTARRLEGGDDGAGGVGCC